MATVTELLDRASQITGLRLTGTERTLALQALQNTYRRACLEAESDPQPVSWTVATVADSYNMASVLGATPVRLLHVRMSSSGGPFNLTQTSMQELMDNRATDDLKGLPCLYATIGFDRIALYPTPSIGNVISVWYLADTPTLIESAPGAGQESTPSKIPVAFHWDVLLAGTVLELLDKDQRNKVTEFWMGRYERGIARLVEHIGQMGGNANRAYIAVGGSRPYLRDERIR